jgi:hypothetical protein
MIVIAKELTVFSTGVRHEVNHQLALCLSIGYDNCSRYIFYLLDLQDKFPCKGAIHYRKRP